MRTNDTTAKAFAMSVLAAAGLLQPAAAAGSSAQSVKIYVLSGQSNMTGRGELGSLSKPAAEQKATLVRYIMEPQNVEKYRFLHEGPQKNREGWTIRDDVFITTGERHGGLTTNYGGFRDKGFGPELPIGHLLGDHHDEPVLLVKVAFGGCSLSKDMRPPSSGGTTGEKYPQIVQAVKNAIGKLPEIVPGYTRENGYEIVGFFWNQGESDMNPEAAAEYETNLVNLIKDLRQDLGAPAMKSVIAVTGFGGWNPAFGKAEAKAAAEQVIAAQFAVSKRPEFKDAAVTVETRDFYRPQDPFGGNKQGIHWHANGESYWLVGEAMARGMLSLLPGKPKPPSDLKFIDPHVHAMSVTPLGLRAVANWMEERNVERCIVSPLNHKGSRPQNEEERKTMLEQFRPYKGRIDRMAIIDPGEVGTVEEAVTILKREIADGAIAFGEHYGVGLKFDDPKNLMLYEACEKAGLPVMFHIDQNKNMVEPGMERVDRVLKMFPECKFIAHAYWWRQLQHGDRQLQEHPNLYADMSGSVVINVLNRDRKYAREFLIRNQDKILWATDEGWWSFGDRNKGANQHYTFFEELDLPDEVRRKIYRDNAIKVYGL